MWIILAICSSISLGIYDVFRKKSLEKNAVLPVLFVSNLTGALIFLPLILFSFAAPDLSGGHFLHVPFSGFAVQKFIFLKAMLVVSSWIFTFFAFKHLPLTIASPIRSAAPIWTIIGAIVLLGERLSLLQWTGLIVSLIFFYLFSFAGSKEGYSFRNNKWVWFMIIGTVLGSCSALYDKFLIKRFDRLEVQAWFSVYQVVVMIPVLLLVWYPVRKSTTPFVWRWSILFIAVFLVTADFIYFYAIGFPGALISLISTIRRSNVVISFTAGVLMFKEKNVKTRALLLMGILAGIAVMYCGT
ncbi:MAG: EamA family transporter [Fibrobacter sp.]|nr:EamA family transporter [Fibrobacter sp.]